MENQYRREDLHSIVPLLVKKHNIAVVVLQLSGKGLHNNGLNYH